MRQSKFTPCYCLRSSEKNAMPSRIRTHCPNCYEQYALRDFACHHCGRVRDEKSLAEMMASGQGFQTVLPWLWAFAGISGLLWVATFFVTFPHPSQPTPTPVVYVPTPEERMAQVKQKAADAKYWAAKEKREAAEVDNYAGGFPGASGIGTASNVGTDNKTPAETVSSDELFFFRNRPSSQQNEAGSHSGGATQGGRGTAL